jgi:hypothetical protein
MTIMRKARLRLLLTFSLLGAAALSSAEVMDKVPGVLEVWIWVPPLAVLAYAIGRFLPLLGLGFCMLPSVPTGTLFEIHDPHVGSAIWREAGLPYVAGVYAANGVILAALVLGVSHWLRKRRRAKTGT